MTEIKIPLRIVSEANTHEHWHKAAKRHTEQQMMVKAYLPSYPPSLPCHVTLTRGAPRKLDGQDNLRMAFKWIVDAVAVFLTNNYIPGQADSDPRITWEYKQEKTSNKEYYIKISVEPHTPN